MTRQEAFDEINSIQDSYVDELINMINNPAYVMMKTIDFTSPTGTGKTKMMSKLINRFPDYYFIVTTLSKGQLHVQVRNSLMLDCKQSNFIVYGSADYKINSILQADDIISHIPENSRCIWLRDEGHIRTNRFEELLMDKCYKVINFSATNVRSDIKCNFTQTMMLRTVSQSVGTPEDAVLKLLEVKKAHKQVLGYNPCAIFRCIGSNNYILNSVTSLCDKYGLKYINITDEAFDMSDLCRDDNEYDVIINKFKLVEGIDIRRAHVLYMDNQPTNAATTIQVIGRCRRNALLYRDDIDILAAENKMLLEQTRKCYVFYNVDNMKVDTDIYGELQYAFCDYVSCESLKPHTTIDVVDGQLANGLYVLELEHCTGKFDIAVDKKTNFNVVKPATKFYSKSTRHVVSNNSWFYNRHGKISFDNVRLLPLWTLEHNPSHKDDEPFYVDAEPYYIVDDTVFNQPMRCCVMPDAIVAFQKCMEKFDCVLDSIKNHSIDEILHGGVTYDVCAAKKNVLKHLKSKRFSSDCFWYCNIASDIEHYSVKFHGLNFVLGQMFNSDELYLMLNNAIRFGSFGLAEYITNWISLVFGYYSHNCSDGMTKLFKSISNVNYAYPQRRSSVNRYLSNTNSNFADRLSDISNLPLFVSCNDYERIAVQYSLMKAQKDGLSNGMLDAAFTNAGLLHWILAKYGYVFCESEFLTTKSFTEFVLSHNISKIYDDVQSVNFRASAEYPDLPVVDADVVIDFFDDLYSLYNYMWQADTVIDRLSKAIKRLEVCLKQNDMVCNVFYSAKKLFVPLTAADFSRINNGYLRSTYSITKKDFDSLTRYKPYSKVVNDRESAIIGVDLMRQVKTSNGVSWIESKPVTAKISSYTKLNKFLSDRYAVELLQARPQCFSGHNNFSLNNRCNSVIGYCVEYYSKYLLYGESYLGKLIERATNEYGKATSWFKHEVNDAVIVRACMLKYRDEMMLCYGQNVGGVIRSIGVAQLIKDEYDYFVKLVVELGSRTARYVKSILYPDGEPKNDVDPNLSIEHIVGLADYITTDTILDVKVRNNIDEKCIRQVLAYHYLSTKRSDLHIKRVIVYDAVSDRAAVVDISAENIK
ncbi:hypothetical protein [Roseburia inulinivorans]